MTGAPDGRVSLTAQAMENSVVWGADGTGTVGLSVVPIDGKFDIAVGVARRQRKPGGKHGAPSISNAAGMTLEDAERVVERMKLVIEEVRRMKRG